MRMPTVLMTLQEAAALFEKSETHTRSMLSNAWYGPPARPIMYFKARVLALYNSEVRVKDALNARARGIAEQLSEAIDETAKQVPEEIRSGTLTVFYGPNDALFPDENSARAAWDHVNKKVTMLRRRRDVALLFAQGLPYKEIAKRLGVSFSTVQSDVRTLALPYSMIPREERYQYSNPSFYWPGQA